MGGTSEMPRVDMAVYNKNIADWNFSPDATRTLTAL